MRRQKTSIVIRAALGATITALVVFAALYDLRGATYTWQSQNGDWSSATNWGGVLPSGSDTALIANGGTIGITGAGPVCNTLIVGTLDGPGTLQISAGSLNVSSVQYIGYTGTGTVTQSGGTISNTSGSLILGNTTGSFGSYTLNGNGRYFTKNEEIGYEGGGIFTQTGGTNNVSSEINLGLVAGSSGTYVLSGSSLLSTHDETIGWSGTGTFTQNANHTVSTELDMGYAVGGMGIYNQGSGALTAQYEYIGNSGSATYSQSGGSNVTPSPIYLGNSSTGNGVYNLSGSGQVTSTSSEYVGNHGIGIFTQSGGTNNATYLYLGNFAGSSGAYSLSGSGYLPAYYEYIGVSGSGNFTQTGGTNMHIGAYALILGTSAGGVGSYNLQGNSLLSQYSEYIGSSGTGTLTHSGGTNTLVAGLYLGYGAGSSGTYSLNGSGTLSAASEYIGVAGTAAFLQSNCANVTSLLAIGPSGTYQLAGGTLQVYGSMLNQGIFAGTGAAATFSGSGILDLSQGTCQGLNGVSANIMANSLLIVSANFNPATGFASYSNLGLTHTAGTTLTIPAGQAVFGSGSISDPVVCQGTLAASSGGTINLSGIVAVSGVGAINSGSGSMTTNDSSSFISGGTLQVVSHYIGNGGNALFTQLGGLHLCNNLFLGYSPGNSGSYSLGGNGQLSTNLLVGYSGTGLFTQSGGVNNTNSSLFLGYNSGSYGVYNLGSGLVQDFGEYVGNFGSGAFTQTGGTNNISDSGLAIGYGASSSGVYNLSGSGQLSCAQMYLGYSGSGTFSQSGGTNTISSYFYLGFTTAGTGTYNLNGGLLVLNTNPIKGPGVGFFNFNGGTLAANGIGIAMPMTLGATGGTATFDASGIVVTLSSPLSGPGSFIKADSGTLILSASNSYTGTTAIAGGVLRLSNSAALNGGGPISFGGGTLQYSTSNTLDLSGRINASRSPISIDTNGQSITFATDLGNTNAGGLTKSGSGILTLAAPNDFTGNAVVSKGTLTLANPLALQNITLDTSGSGALSFGPLSAATVGNLTGTGALKLSNSASSVLALSVGNNNANSTFIGALSGPGNVIKVGSGSLLLSGSNTYTGPTTINQGTLRDNGSLASPVTVNSGGVLGGTGSLTSVTVNAGGHLAPGNSPGILTLSGSLTLLAGAVMDYDLDTPLKSDEILMPTSLLALNGQQFSDFNFTPLSGFGPGTYDLIDAGSITGSLGPSTSGTIAGFSAGIATQGNDVVLTVVPEPSTMVLLATGMLCLLAYARLGRPFVLD